MKFCWSTLYVKDLDESVQFYQKEIGLDLLRRFKEGKQVEIAFLGDGTTQLELIHDTSRPGGEVGKDISWGFAVESLDKTFDKMKASGAKILCDPVQPAPHVRFFFMEDPNGFKIQIVQNL
ncbi:MAG: VOC family protein [Ethanoligenens sp.]|uniref:VOC family protein n=1 Tax=Ethanoligenens sp. TaxID=2099655 RepID=UPI0039ED083C